MAKLATTDNCVTKRALYHWGGSNGQAAREDNLEDKIFDIELIHYIIVPIYKLTR